MHELPENTAALPVKQEKKTWISPCYEIISKEIIKSGVISGNEGASAGYSS